MGDPGGDRYFLASHTGEAFFQDKWHVSPRLTFSLGARFDLEVIPIRTFTNPLQSDPTEYPVDKDNISPRLGFSWDPNGDGTSVIRGGYGIFYDKQHLTILNEPISSGEFLTSVELNFPLLQVDPGPENGQLPTDPLLVNGPVLDRAQIDQLFPAGQIVRNTGTVFFNAPDRRQPFSHQFTVGYERQLAPTLSVAADYIHMEGRDNFISRNLNPATRAGINRTDRITRSDAFGVLGTPFSVSVLVRENRADSKYDALNVQVEKRMSDNWAARVAYTLAYSRGDSDGSATTTSQSSLAVHTLGRRSRPARISCVVPQELEQG